MSKLAEEIAVMFIDYLEATEEPKWSGAELASEIDQKLSDVRGGLLEILWDSMGQGFGDKALNARLKNIDGVAVRLCESLKVE